MAANYRVLFGLAALGVAAILCLSSWLFLYTDDLPDISHLSEFAPTRRHLVTDVCLTGASFAIPVDRIPETFQDALASAEPRLSLSDQVAWTLMCNRRERAGTYHLNTFRLSWQLRRRFSQQQLFAIYVNRAYFGSGATGLENASAKFCHQGASNLSIPQAALLAGLLRAPDYLSPFEHPERALQRRNKVLEVMVTNGRLNAAEASKAEGTPVVSFFSSDEELQFPLPLSTGVLAALLKTRQANEGLDFASDEERRNPAQLFRAAEIHLRSSDETDLVVIGVPPMSGADNDWFWVVRSAQGHPEVVLFSGGYSLELLNSTTKGYRDIRSEWSSAQETAVTTYRFNGKEYKAIKVDNFENQKWKQAPD